MYFVFFPTLTNSYAKSNLQDSLARAIEETVNALLSKQHICANTEKGNVKLSLKKKIVENCIYTSPFPLYLVCCIYMIESDAVETWGEEYLKDAGLCGMIRAGSFKVCKQSNKLTKTF